MYYVPDGTTKCGYYECEDCGTRFLALQIAPKLVCPYCGEEPDMEIGPDEEMPVAVEHAKLLQVVEGEEQQHTVLPAGHADSHAVARLYHAVIVHGAADGSGKVTQCVSHGFSPAAKRKNRI